MIPTRCSGATGSSRRGCASTPELRRIVVAVDPPAGQGEARQACGIVCAGLGDDGRCYVLDDRLAARRSPAQWAARVVALYRGREAGRVVAEVNQGGAMVEAVLREVDPGDGVPAVHASRGKRRAPSRWRPSTSRAGCACRRVPGTRG